MWRILQGLGRQMAATQFRRGIQGWIFRAPTPWVFGPRPHYVVDEAQKAKIEIIVGAGRIVFYLLLILAVMWFGVYLTGRIGLKTASKLDDHLLVFMLACLLSGVVHNLYQCLALWPQLRTLPRTAEQITLVERLKPLAMYSKRLLIFALLFLTVAFLVMTYRALTSRPWDIAAYIAVAGIGLMAIYYGLALWVRRRLGRVERNQLVILADAASEHIVSVAARDPPLQKRNGLLHFWSGLRRSR
jgi:hypothetical protein